MSLREILQKLYDFFFRKSNTYKTSKFIKFNLGDESSYTFRISTARTATSEEILGSSDLQAMQISTDDIKKIQIFHDFRSRFYPELGVARKSHPLLGSGGVNIKLYDDTIVSSQILVYHDRGHSHKPPTGQPHWNVEKRYVTKDGREVKNSRISSHMIIPDDDITLELDTPQKKYKKKKKYSASLGGAIS